MVCKEDHGGEALGLRVRRSCQEQAELWVPPTIRSVLSSQRVRRPCDAGDSALLEPERALYTFVSWPHKDSRRQVPRLTHHRQEAGLTKLSSRQMLHSTR